MTPTLWVGIICIVLVLEALRIALTTYVLLHILDSRALRRHGETAGQAGRSLRSAPARARREALADPTLLALRAAMDDLAAHRAGPGVRGAVAALDHYARVMREQQEQESA